MDNCCRPQAEPMACGRTGAVTHLAKRISLFLFERKGRKAPALLSFAALQDRLALLPFYVIFDVVRLDGSPCSGLSRRLAAAPPHALLRHTAPFCTCFSPHLWAGLPRRFYRAGRGWFPVALGAGTPWLRAMEAMVRVARWAVCEDSPFGPTPAPARQHQHASNSSGYDNAPLAEANG